jgi:hypothetical protein
MQQVKNMSASRPGDRNTPPDQAVGAIEAALLDRRGKRKGDEIRACCPFHDEERPSFSFNTFKGAFKCQACGESGGWKKLAQKLGIPVGPDRPNRRRQPRAQKRIVATYDYTDENGTLLFQTVRFEPKEFQQRRPDGKDGWIWNLNGVRRVLYRTHDLVDPRASDAIVCVVEGEKDVDRLCAERLLATCNAMGAGKWRPEYTEQLRGRCVVVIPDNDDPGRKHASAVAAALFGVAASVAVLELPGLREKGDVSDWLEDAGHTVTQVIELAAERLRSSSLADVHAAFGRWLHMPDLAPLHVLLGAVAANRMQGDPVWPMFVGPPGSGKTELLGSLSKLPDVHQVGTLTEAALLSGTPAREKAADAKGGLLRELGAFGFLVAKDFTTTLNLPRDTRASVLAALREIYDGHWTRRLGTDGGRCLTWEGKVALFAGCTPSIDSHHAVIAAMGERFIFVRMAVEDAAAQGMRALDHVDSEQTMRAELAGAVQRFFGTLVLPAAPPALTTPERHTLVALVSLAVRCRSAVERDGYHREIQLVPYPEAPTRLALILARLMAGMRLVGVPGPDVWRVVTKVALDSMPQLRRVVFDLLNTSLDPIDTTSIATAIGYPTQTTRRACEDLAAHGVVDRLPGGEGKADRWQLSEWAREQLAKSTVPEMSQPGGANGAAVPFPGISKGGEPSDPGSRVPEMSEGGEPLRSDSPSYINTDTLERDFSGKVSPHFLDDAREVGE